MQKKPKQAMREAIKTLRDSLDIASLSQSICRRIEESGLLIPAKRACVYYPLPGELDLLPLLQQYPHIEWCFPKTIQTEHSTRLLFYPIDHNTQFLPGTFGVLEPTEFWPALTDFSNVDFILLPALAYDALGNRLGYGKGVYDQFFRSLESLPADKQFSGKRVGVSAEATIFDSLPADPWDVRVQLLYTEKAVYQFDS